MPRFQLHRALRMTLVVTFLFGMGLTARAEEQTNAEYRIYEAVLKLISSIPTADPHVVIYDRTLNGKCDAASNNPVFANGCTFLWVTPDTDQQVQQMLRRRFHGLDKSTWKNFKAANTTSITLHDPIATPWKHRIAGEDTPVEASQDWSSPDMAIYFSRVGFNSKKNEALVYVLAFSYVGRQAATGDYLRFRSGPDHSWSFAGRVRYMIQDNDLFVDLQPHEHRVPGGGVYVSQPGPRHTAHLHRIAEQK